MKTINVNSVKEIIVSKAALIGTGLIALAGGVSATYFTDLLGNITELITGLGTLMPAFIPLIFAIVILMIVMAVGTFVTGIFAMVLHKLSSQF